MADSTTDGAQSKAAELLQRLEAGVQTLTNSESWAHFLQVQARFHSYSFSNVLAILLQRPDATRVAGFNTWKALGRYVKRGEHGIAILAPITQRVAVAAEPTAEADDDDAGTTSTKVRRANRFRVVHVFDISQTDGEPLPSSPAERLTSSTDTGRDLYRRLLEIASEDGITVQPDADLPRRVNGDCDPVRRVIRLAAGLSEDHRARTLCHEMAHAWLHQLGGDRAEQEAEAEGIAYVVGSWAGLNCDGYSFGYVAGWAMDKGGAAILKRVGATIQRTAAAMIQRLEPAAEERQSA